VGEKLKFNSLVHQAGALKPLFCIHLKNGTPLQIPGIKDISKWRENSLNRLPGNRILTK
jgi:hypothetical protein